MSETQQTSVPGDGSGTPEASAQEGEVLGVEAGSRPGIGIVAGDEDDELEPDDEDEPDDELEHPTGSNAAPPEHADPESTVMESGELRVVTTVKGLTTSCSLFIDDKPAGNTPCSLQLPEGRHQVRVERPTFKPVEKSVVVKANEVVLARLELQPPPAK